MIMIINAVNLGSLFCLMVMKRCEQYFDDGGCCGWLGEVGCVGILTKERALKCILVERTWIQNTKINYYYYVASLIVENILMLYKRGNIAVTHIL